MIYITGDTHIPVDIGKLSSKRFSEQKHLTSKDYVIICGDFGGIWSGDAEEKYYLKWLSEKNFTTLFIDGNHENFTRLGTFPEEIFCGGKVHKITEKIYHLMRGQVFNIDGKTVFTLGGAESHDKEYRKEGKNWWNEELPSEEELETALKNLEKVNMSVDYVITHCAPTGIQQNLSSKYENNVLTDFLEKLQGKLSYKKWFFGHYHTDKEVNSQHTAVFERIILLQAE